MTRHPSRDGGADNDARLRGYAFRTRVGLYTLEAIEVAKVAEVMGDECRVESSKVKIGGEWR